MCEIPCVLIIMKCRMSAIHHLCAYNRERATGPLEAGQSVTSVVIAIGVSKSSISRF